MFYVRAAEQTCTDASGGLTPPITNTVDLIMKLHRRAGTRGWVSLSSAGNQHRLSSIKVFKFTQLPNLSHKSTSVTSYSSVRSENQVCLSHLYFKSGPSRSMSRLKLSHQYSSPSHLYSMSQRFSSPGQQNSNLDPLYWIINPSMTQQSPWQIMIHQYSSPSH